jgi:hypothetical protein
MITFKILWKLICADCGYKVDLSNSDLSNSDLRGSDLRGSNLRGSNLSNSDLSNSNLSNSNLRGSDLRGSDLRGSDLRGSDLRGSNLSGAKNFFDPISYLKKNFEMTNLGLICYKTFNENYTPNPNWKIEIGAELTEIVNPNITNDCGCGINVATLQWVQNNCSRSNVIWKCLIPTEALCSIVVPINTNGKIRCGMIKLLEVIQQ